MTSEACLSLEAGSQEVGPVVLLVIAVDLEVLFQSLVSTFSLSITLEVVTGGEVQFHV